MDIGLMEERLKQFEEDVFSDKEINTNDFYQLKKDLVDSNEANLLMKHRMIEQMIEKNANDLDLHSTFYCHYNSDVSLL